MNAADMHRLRQSLPYFEQFGWKPIIFTVDPKFVEQSQDPLLLESIPSSVEIHRVRAWPTRWTRKLGLGNLGIRSFLYLWRAVDEYLEKHEVDLIYFSTTVFTVMVLGRYWKWRFGVPFVIDLQDPWRNDYYLSLPKAERPAKFWFDYRQKKFLEAKTIPAVDGIIAVSQAYIDTVKSRYPAISKLPYLTLPFGVLASDFDIARRLPSSGKESGSIEIVYVGRGGLDMRLAIRALFVAFAEALQEKPDLYSNARFRFIGSSYAADGKGSAFFTPLAKEYGVEQYVVERTDRLPYFESLRALLDADILFVPGSDDSSYTASKIYPYILAQRPLLAVFNEQSSVVEVLKVCEAGDIVTFNSREKVDQLAARVKEKLDSSLSSSRTPSDVNWKAFDEFLAPEMTRRQCAFFDSVLQDVTKRMGTS